MKLPSLQRECSFVWSEDPALDAPDYADAPKANAKAKEKEAWKERLTAWRRKLDTARDSGNYAAITKAGQSLTLFDLRIIPEPQWRAVVDLVQTRQLGLMEGNAIMVRLALLSVQNLDNTDGKPFVLERKTSDRWGQVAGEDIVDLLAIYHRELQKQNPGRTVANPIDEMADFVIRRQGGVRPLS